MDHKVELRDEQLKQPLAAVLSEPEKTLSSIKNDRLVIMVHGFPGDKDAHGDFFGFLNNIFDAQAIPTLRFDFHGCGQSTGRTQDFSLSSAQHDLQGVFSWAEKEGYSRIIVVGEGLGAWLTLANMTKNIEMMFLFWPVMNPAAFGQSNFPMPGIEKLSDLSGFKVFSERNIGLRLIKELSETKIPVVPELNIPVMVQHGVQDDIVPVDQLDILKEKIIAPRLDLTSYQDGEHGLTDPRHRQMIAYHMGQFLERYA